MTSQIQLQAYCIILAAITTLTNFAIADSTNDALDHVTNFAIDENAGDRLLLAAPAGTNPDDDLADPGSKRSRAIALDMNALDSITEAGGGLMWFDLFDDRSYQGVFQRIERRGPDDYTWFGKLAGVTLSEFTLTRYQDVVYLNIHDHENIGRFQVRWRGGPFGVVREIGDGPRPQCGNYQAPVPDVGLRDTNCSVSMGSCSTTVEVTSPIPSIDTGSTIDIIIVWTPEARSEEGGTSSMTALVNSSISDMNTRLANSEVTPRVRLVYYGELSGYVENGADELSRLGCPNDGYMDQIHTLRETYNADLVHLIVSNIDNDCGFGCVTAGVGYLPTTYNDCNSIWNVVSISDNSYSDGGTFAHEVGHNLGCCHNASECSLTPIESYAYGRCWYVFPAYRTTTMSYDCTGLGASDAIPYFSNPNVSISDSPTGTATENNAQVIQDTRMMVTNYRLGDHMRFVGPYNNLPMGNGSEFLPYTRILFGIFSVAPTGTVSILGGSYPEGPMVINRSCKLVARGGNVTISAP